jgi:hypothetical protein
VLGERSPLRMVVVRRVREQVNLAHRKMIVSSPEDQAFAVRTGIGWPCISR